MSSSPSWLSCSAVAGQDTNPWTHAEGRAALGRGSGTPTEQGQTLPVVLKHFPRELAMFYPSGVALYRSSGPRWHKRRERDTQGQPQGLT